MKFYKFIWFDKLVCIVKGPDNLKHGDTLYIIKNFDANVQGNILFYMSDIDCNYIPLSDIEKVKYL